MSIRIDVPQSILFADSGVTWAPNPALRGQQSKI